MFSFFCYLVSSEHELVVIGKGGHGSGLVTFAGRSEDELNGPFRIRAQGESSRAQRKEMGINVESELVSDQRHSQIRSLSLEEGSLDFVAYFVRRVWGDVVAAIHGECSMF